MDGIIGRAQNFPPPFLFKALHGAQ